MNREEFGKKLQCFIDQFESEDMEVFGHQVIGDGTAVFFVKNEIGTYAIPVHQIKGRIVVIPYYGEGMDLDNISFETCVTSAQYYFDLATMSEEQIAEMDEDGIPKSIDEKTKAELLAAGEKIASGLAPSDESANPIAFDDGARPSDCPGY